MYCGPAEHVAHSKVDALLHHVHHDVLVKAASAGHWPWCRGRMPTKHYFQTLRRHNTLLTLHLASPRHMGPHLLMSIQMNNGPPNHHVMMCTRGRLSLHTAPNPAPRPPRRWGSPRGYRLQHIAGIPQVLPPQPTFNATRGIDWSYYKVRCSGRAACRSQETWGWVGWIRVQWVASCFPSCRSVVCINTHHRV